MLWVYFFADLKPGVIARQVHENHRSINIHLLTIIYNNFNICLNIAFVLKML